jgi:hypothetical protein
MDTMISPMDDARSLQLSAADPEALLDKFPASEAEVHGGTPDPGARGKQFENETNTGDFSGLDQFVPPVTFGRVDRSRGFAVEGE